MDEPPVRGGDSRQFAGELQSLGAFKFFDDTEAILRAGKFELAFGRYCFLNTHIRGQSIYAGLIASVDQRLQFLKGQMRLGEGVQSYAPEEKPTRRRRAKRVQPPCPPPVKTAKAKEPSPEEKPPEMIIPAPPEEEKATPPPPAEAKPPGEETKPPGEETKPPGEKAQEAQKPAPAPSSSLWEKLKRRLKFW
jgi:hypothetical protein